MWKVNGRRTPSDDKSSRCLWQGQRQRELLSSLIGRFLNKSSPQKPLGQLQPNFGGIVLGWPPSKFVSGDPDFQPRWPPS
jgi:hypothetical protein